MTLGDDIAATLPRLRAEAESMMVDACIIHGDPVTVFNEETLENEETIPVIYEGRCKYRLSDAAIQPVEAVGQSLIVQRATLSLPIGSSRGIRKNHVATITASKNDPEMVGMRLLVKDSFRHTNATARRLPVEEIS